MPTAEPIKNYRLWLAGFFSLTHHYNAYRCRSGNEGRHLAGFSSNAGISGPLPWQKPRQYHPLRRLAQTLHRGQGRLLE